jgi:hypothetical protein
MGFMMEGQEKCQTGRIRSEKGAIASIEKRIVVVQANLNLNMTMRVIRESGL